MSVTVARFLDVSEGLQPNQFTVGSRDAITSISDQTGMARRQAKIVMARTVPRNPPWNDMPPCQTAKISVG